MPLHTETSGGAGGRMTCSADFFHAFSAASCGWRCVWCVHGWTRNMGTRRVWSCKSYQLHVDTVVSRRVQSESGVCGDNQWTCVCVSEYHRDRETWEGTGEGLYYEQEIKWELHGILMWGCRCNERLKVKTEGSTLLTYYLEGDAGVTLSVYFQEE